MNPNKNLKNFTVMKKMILMLAAVAVAGMTQTNAQLRGGIKVDGTLSNFALADMDGVKSKMGFGVSVGGFTKIEMGDWFALQPEVLLHYKNSKQEQAGEANLDYQYFGVEIPIYALGQTAIGNGKGFVGIGPYVAFGMDARHKASGAGDVKLYKEDILQPWDFGGGAMLGYEFKNGLQIAATYKIGCINALDKEKNEATMLNQTVSLGLGFRF